MSDETYTLTILGKGDFKEEDIIGTLWTVGTHEHDADSYFEYHGIEYKNRQMIREISDKVKKLGLPLNNSVSIMLAEAYIQGFTKIRILGCSMEFTEEYITQARSVAYTVGFLVSKGLFVEWYDSKLDFENIYPYCIDNKDKYIVL